MNTLFKIGQTVQFECYQSKGTWYDGVIEAFFDAYDMKPLPMGPTSGVVATAIDLSDVFKGPHVDRGHCRSRMVRIKIKTGLWAEGYYNVLIIRDVPPGCRDTDMIRHKVAS